MIAWMRLDTLIFFRDREEDPQSAQKRNITFVRDQRDDLVASRLFGQGSGKDILFIRPCTSDKGVREMDLLCHEKMGVRRILVKDRRTGKMVGEKAAALFIRLDDPSMNLFF